MKLENVILVFLAIYLALLVLVQTVLIISGMTAEIIFPSSLFFVMFSHVTFFQQQYFQRQVFRDV